jgi:crotonobetainyl-CoA:carnitine CoA-transferase CaiB-like acyl-CoA transferase
VAVADVFAGVRVLDLTEGFAGSLATMVMADHGAAVIRAVPPPDPDRTDPAEAAAGFRQWQRSKAIHQLPDLEPDGAGGAEVAGLVAEADVVVATGHARAARVLPGATAGAAGAAGAAVSARLAGLVAAHPGLVACLIDGFGDHPTYGGLPDHGTLVHAACGRMQDYAGTFQRDRPVYVAPPQAAYAAGTAALQGITAALYVRARTGRGQLVRTSLLRAFTAFDFWGPHGRKGFTPPPGPSPELGPFPQIGYIPAPTKDGRWLQWANYAPHLLWGELDLLGLGHLRDDPRFAKLPACHPDDAHIVWELVLEATSKRTAAEWMTIMGERGTTGGDIVVHTREGMDHPQVRFNGTVVTVDDPEVGPCEQIGPIAAMADTPMRIGVRDWGAAGPVRRTASGTGAAPAAGRPPLDGVLVVEAATMIATPWGANVLADLGARVIKIEPLGGEAGRGLPFIKMLLGKQSVTVDLKAAEGLAAVHRLIARADVFLHNYRPGVPEKLGIDAATLRGINPRLVYLYAGAYGPDGPCAKMPGYHPVAGAVSGGAALQTGEVPPPAGAAPTMAEWKAESLRRGWANEGHPDPVTGMAAAAAILMALLARERDGVGQAIDVSMLTANAYMMSDDWCRWPGAPERPRVDADILGTGPLDHLYPAREGWVFACAPTNAEFRALCGVLGLDGLAADTRFATPADRLASAPAAGELAAALGAAIAARTADELEAAGVAAGIGLVRADRQTFVELQQHEIDAGRTGLASFTHSPQLGDHWRAAAIVEMDGLGGIDGLAGACWPGAHTRSVLAELGYAPEEVEDLLARGVVGEPAAAAGT